MFLSFLFSIVLAQSTIEHANKLLWAGDSEGCQKVLDSITEADFQNMTDFDLFLYHYLQVKVRSKVKKDHAFTRNHNESCKRMMETSVGVWGNPFYPEVIWSLAYDYEKLGMFDEALYTLEEGITKCISWIYTSDSNETATEWYSQVLGYTAYLYEHKGLMKEVTLLYEDAFDAISHSEDKSGKGAAFLSQLSLYYNLKKDYNRSAIICEQGQSYLSERGLSNTVEYAGFLYDKSDDYYHLGNFSMAFDSIMHVIELLETNGLSEEYLYPNAVSLAVIYSDGHDVIGSKKHLDIMKRYRFVSKEKDNFNDYIIKMEKYIETLYRSRKEEQGDEYSEYLIKSVQEDLPHEDITSLKKMLLECKTMNQ